MTVKGFRVDGTFVEESYVSIGGGAYRKEGEGYLPKDIYPFSTFDGMKAYLAKNNVDDIETVIEKIEGRDILVYGEELLRHSFETIEEGLRLYDVLPGPLRLHSVASKIYEKAAREENRDDRRLLLLAAYSYATAEENARGKAVVTAPTCGASGVVPAVLYLCKQTGNFAFPELVRAYLVGALVCNFIKENAAISGAVYGCQAEIGSACSFAAAALCALHRLPVYQIEYAAEVAMEHFLGLTCDPVEGCVQIPCIERNAMASIHAYSSFLFSKDIAPLRHNRVSFDNVVRAMKETGKALPKSLKETAQGGLAKIIHYC